MLRGMVGKVGEALHEVFFGRHKGCASSSKAE